LSSLIGQKLNQYEIVALLGKGGMATVYKAYQPSLDRHVAIKVLPPHPGMDENFIERFRLEAKTIGNLQNPNILPLYDYGMSNDILYLVMANVSGGSLADYMDGRLDPRQVVKWVKGIASGLDFAHRQGVVHRDIKPANILIDSDGHPLLADFGVVKMLASNANITGTAIVGTPAYMSPEQGQGLEVDGRSDVYSLGVMTYEMLAGLPPYRADTPMQVILKHITDPTPDIRSIHPELPEAVSAVMNRVLAKDPKDRYATASEFAAELEHALENKTISASVPKPVSTASSDSNATVLLDDSPVTFSKAKPPSSNTVLKQGVAQRAVVRRKKEEGNSKVVMGVFALLALLIVVGGVVAAIYFASRQQEIIIANPPDIITNGIITIPLDENYRGLLKFNSANNFGDTLNLSLQNVRPPQANEKYVVWLLNTENQNFLKLGTLQVFAFGEATLIYNDPNANIETRNLAELEESIDPDSALPLLYNTVIITSEAIAVEPEEPSETILYSGAVPSDVASTLLEIFFASEDGLNGGGLLVGLYTEATIALNHAGLAAEATTTSGQRQHAEHTINILSGTQEDLDGNGRGQNPGRGSGVYIFLNDIDARLDQLTEGAVLPELAFSVENVRICTQNVRRWSDQMIVLEREILNGQTVESVQRQATESSEIANQMINGVDANQNGIIEPFEGECGIAQIPEYAVQLVNISVFEGTLDD
jgi:serine/threonine protein kinase